MHRHPRVLRDHLRDQLSTQIVPVKFGSFPLLEGNPNGAPKPGRSWRPLLPKPDEKLRRGARTNRLARRAIGDRGSAPSTVERYARRCPDGVRVEAQAVRQVPDPIRPALMVAEARGTWFRMFGDQVVLRQIGRENDLLLICLDFCDRVGREGAERVASFPSGKPVDVA